MDEEEEDGLNLHDMPIHQKGMEIYDLTSKIVALIPDGDEGLDIYKRLMTEDALLLSTKVAGAEGMGLYDMKMECAAIIRKAARDLLVHCRGLEMSDFHEVQYLDLIREEIEQYRLLFIEWISTFDPWDYEIDRWGLFNPPGVGPFDEDSDDFSS
ncbi:MAG: hypothetical protein KI790_18850 [Cyclobacteriaceae bacterium]|nr:hypothetical protein [Cyclobacteriaceae bacterium HetDA_MAG_MS6]